MLIFEFLKLYLKIKARSCLSFPFCPLPRTHFNHLFSSAQPPRGGMEGWRRGGMTVWINCAVLLLQFTHSSRPFQASPLNQHRGLLNPLLSSHLSPSPPLTPVSPSHTCVILMLILQRKSSRPASSSLRLQHIPPVQSRVFSVLGILIH